MTRRPARLRFLALAAPLLLGAASAAPVEVPRVTRLVNPILPGFHPDPSVVKVGADFFLVTSSFEYFPGVPVFRSRDLVHWEPIGYALTRASQLPLAKAGVSGGIFAPTIRHHAGRFYMITTNVSAGGNFYVSAQDPAGPWSEPTWVEGQGGIDPSLFFDDDGAAYLTSTGGAPGEPHVSGIYQSRIEIGSGRLLSPPRLIWRGTGGRYPEGPHLYKIAGRYYLMISEGGTEYGHMVTIARSASPWGPFEACPRNPILTHRNTENDQTIQGTGHADLVQGDAGRWWLFFLAFRQVGGNFHHLGRETFLAPLEWDAAGWPVVNDGEPIALEAAVAGWPEAPVAIPPVRDGFDGPLGLAWNFVRNPDAERCSTMTVRGWLLLRGGAETLGDATQPGVSPTFVGRRQEHLSCRAATFLDFTPRMDGEEAGLTVFQNGEHRYDVGVRRVGGKREVFTRQTIGPHLSAVTASRPLLDNAPVILEVRATPEEYTLWYGSLSGRLSQLDTARSRYLSSEVAGGFTGVYFGLYATGNGQTSSSPALFDWFDYEPAGR